MCKRKIEGSRFVSMKIKSYFCVKTCTKLLIMILKMNTDTIENLDNIDTDYTKWQRNHFDDVDLETFVNAAAKYAESVGK